MQRSKITLEFYNRYNDNTNPIFHFWYCCVNNTHWIWWRWFVITFFTLTLINRRIRDIYYLWLINLSTCPGVNSISPSSATFTKTYIANKFELLQSGMPSFLRKNKLWRGQRVRTFWVSVLHGRHYLEYKGQERCHIHESTVDRRGVRNFGLA